MKEQKKSIEAWMTTPKEINSKLLARLKKEAQINQSLYSEKEKLKLGLWDELSESELESEDS